MPHHPETVLIVGAGIVGSALAHFLSSSSNNRTITVLDRSLSPLRGSTAHAPGFIGQFNDSDVLTRLAIDSVAEYTKVSGGFDPVGGLEIASSPAQISRLKSRCHRASQMGLPAEMTSITRAAELAPMLLKESPGAALHFPTDGTANAGRLTSFYQDKAKQAGVQFLERDVKRLLITEGRVRGVEFQNAESLNQVLKADIVILATGIWAQDLCRDFDIPVPVVPVGHPYMYGRTRQAASLRMPFVRWPENHVYARDHGDFFGIGTYGHDPTCYKPTNGNAIGDWVKGFEEPLNTAIDLLPKGSREEFEGGKRFNGIFSMTPDNLPLIGKVQSVQGLFMAVAVWVTHAAGAAKVMTKIVEGLEVDQQTLRDLDPERFQGQDLSTLEQKSLQGYNEIYKTIGSSGSH